MIDWMARHRVTTFVVLLALGLVFCSLVTNAFAHEKNEPVPLPVRHPDPVIVFERDHDGALAGALIAGAVTWFVMHRRHKHDVPLFVPPVSQLPPSVCEEKLERVLATCVAK